MIHQNICSNIINFITIQSYLVYKKNLNNYIVTLYIKNKNNLGENTIIFSHSHLSTLGEEYPFLIDLSLMLKCDIISFDYSGYCLSNGSSDIFEILVDYQTIVNFSINILGVNMNKMFLMSHSLGNIPLIYFSTYYNIKKIKGLILISPISSYKFNNTNLINKEKICRIICPIFIIHGIKDNIISINHSIELSKYIKYLSKWFPKKSSHYILSENRHKFYQKLKFFLNIKCNNVTFTDSLTQNLKSENNSNIFMYINYSIQREENFIEDEDSKDNQNQNDNQKPNNNSNYTFMKKSDSFNYDMSEMSYNY